MKIRMFAMVGGMIGALFLAGCGSILIRPAVDNVKTVALVSVYMNRDFYDVKAPRSSDSMEALKTLGRAALKETKVLDKLDDLFAKERQAMVAYGVKAYSEQLEGVGNWRWVPVTNVLTNKSYRKFVDSVAGKHPVPSLVKAAATVKAADWYTAVNMVHIPMDSVARNGSHVYAGDAKDPQEEMRRALARLCKDLGVDAVAILQFDMAYQKPMLSLKLIGDDPAIPNISSALVLVNKEGEVCVNSGLIARGQGKRFEGNKVGMLRKGYVHLDAKGVDAYCQAIDKSAQDMRQRLEKAFGKIK